MALKTIQEVHLQFGSFFSGPLLQQYAALVYGQLSEGNICVSLQDAPEQLLQQLASHEQVGSEGEELRPFVLHNCRLYLQRYFYYESRILERIKEFLTDEREQLQERQQALVKEKTFLESLFPPPPTEIPTDWQQAAAISAALNTFTIITGGPGTGKTTTVAKILATLFKTAPELRVALAAPTGKAAARMVESLKSAAAAMDEQLAAALQSLQPNTLHRLLGTISNSPNFRHNRQNPLPFDVIVVDESSMIGVALFAKLLDAVGSQTRLIMLGDKDQLASVEAGSLFGDLCQSAQPLNRFDSQRRDFINALGGSLPAGSELSSGAEHPLDQHVIALQHSYRFSEKGGIGQLSKAVIQGDAAGLQSFFRSDGDEQVRLDEQYSPSVFESVALEYRHYIEEKDIKTALKKLNQVKVLCALREGEWGVQELNAKVERRLQRAGLISLQGEFYENRPVMVTGNNYTLGLYNGDIGIIRKDEQGSLKAWFEDAQGELRAITPGLINQLETVFAMTIHKSQGSEFERLLLVLPPRPELPILSRELLYTGITRGKSKVIIQGTQQVLLESAARKVKRASGIDLRLQNL